MKPEVVLILVLGIGALGIVILNDWWKRRLVDRAHGRRGTIRKDLLSNKTQWGMVIAIAIGIALYAFLLNNPEWTNKNFGPLNPLVEWFFKKPR